MSNFEENVNFSSTYNVDSKNDENFDYSLNGLMKTFKKYSLENENNRVFAVDKKTNERVNDARVISRLKFMGLWINAVDGDILGNKDTKKKDLKFNSEEYNMVYNNLMTEIQKELESVGNIDTKHMSRILSDNYGYSGTLFAKKLFGERKNVEVVYDFVKDATMSIAVQNEENYSLNEWEAFEYLKQQQDMNKKLLNKKNYF